VVLSSQVFVKLQVVKTAFPETRKSSNHHTMPVWTEITVPSEHLGFGFWMFAIELEAMKLPFWYIQAYINLYC